MSINKFSLQKGNVLIVAERDSKGELYTDGIIIYDSYCLSKKGRPHILQEKGSLTNDVIYITGHGKTNQKISGLEMEDIAEMLISNYGYTGNQKIVIASCHGKCKNKDGLDMSDLLQEVFRKQKINSDVSVLGEYTTVILNTGTTAEIYDIPFNEYGFTILQRKRLKELEGLHIEICNIGKYFTENSSNLATYNRSLLIDGVDKKMEMEIKKIFICAIALLIFEFICGLITYFTQNAIVLIISTIIVFCCIAYYFYTILKS